MLDETAKLTQPREHEAKICIWSDLTVSDVDIINDAETPEKIKYELARIFDLGNFENNPKTDVLVELYFNVIQFAKTHGFSKEQMSCLFSIVKKTHEVAIETPFGNLMETFRYFEGLILCHSVKRPPYSIDIFKPDEVRTVVQFVLDTYFRHFKMYKFVFTPMVRLDLSLTYVDDDNRPIEEEPEERPATDAESIAADGAENAEDGERKDDKSDPRTPTMQTESTPPVKDENPAVRELKTMIRTYLAEEMKLLKTEVEHQLKSTEDTINTKIHEVELSVPKSAGKQKSKK